MSTAVVWFRRDLRLADNPALESAADRHDKLVLLYIEAESETEPWSAGAASRWWLHHSLERFDADLAKLGQSLTLKRGPALQCLRECLAESGADAVYWNRMYDPAACQRDALIKEELRGDGIAVESFAANLLFEPWQIRTGKGGPFRVFTPFWRACQRQAEIAEPLPAPASLPSRPDSSVTSVTLDALNLMPEIGWYDGIARMWQPGEHAAHARLADFCDTALADYADGREIPAVAGTSRLSPHLHFGEISPRSVWHRVGQHSLLQRSQPGAEAFLREIGWREFAHHVLFHYPHTPDQPLNSKYADFPWRENHGDLLSAWQRGRTGFPIVDAGMRELWHTGWMHNRVRMIVASLLVKNLRVPWTAGAEWFWDTLVDADLANNTLGWQWAAGCGADAAPYFRIFNPVRQGEKFDPDGSYVRSWIPELAGLPDRWIHKPWEAPDRLRPDPDLYPAPVVDLATSRKAALEALARLKKYGSG